MSKAYQHNVEVKGTPFILTISQNEDAGGFQAAAMDCPGFQLYTSETRLGAMQGGVMALVEFIQVDERSEHQIAVDKMMRLIPGQGVPRFPVSLTPAQRLIRAKLIMEEVFELVCEGLGVKVLDEDYQILEFIDLQFDPCGDFNIVQMIDGCFDAKVVITGTLTAAGIPDLEGQALVDQNNLAKFGPGGHVNAHGKWIKPPNHKPPDILGFLENLCERAGVRLDGQGNPILPGQPDPGILPGQPESG